MNNQNKRYLVVTLVVIVVLFLYFGIGILMEGGMNSGMHGNSLISNSNWRLFPTIVTLLIGVVIGWLLFKKKE
jgi:uncharacterized membrane protein YciS (DUF1049 family)